MQIVLPGRLTSRRLSSFSDTAGVRILLALSANALLAVCAHVSLPLFFTPVPLTLQTFAVILIGFVLGPSLAFSTMILYLVEGVMGLPVFSPAGVGGAAQLLGPTGGYLMAYPLAAALAGFLVRRGRSRFTDIGAALAAGSAAAILILLAGGAWLTHFTHAHFQTAAALGIAPFLPGEAIKVIAASVSFVSLRRYVRA